MNKLGITLSISQEGWLVGCKNEEIIHALENNDLYSVSPVEGEDFMYLFGFMDIDCGMDYIELGIRVVQDIEVMCDII